MYRCSDCGKERPAAELRVNADGRFATGKCCRRWPNESAFRLHPKDESDRIEPTVIVNEFSREALDKVMARGADRSMRATMLDVLYSEPDGCSSSQFEAMFGWLHQSASASLNGLMNAGLIAVRGERVNGRGNREGIYVLSTRARAAWRWS